LAQQKGQWQPGQFELNAGNIPEPGVTYGNLALNFSANRLNGPDGNRILQNVTGNLSVWADENVIYYVPKHKILGGYFMPYVVLTYGSGSLVADITGTNLSTGGGGSGFADMFVQPVNIGWHLKRADVNTGYAFFAPTGQFTQGASNNVGSGYWGNVITSGTTFYVTKNKGTSLSLATAWEIHGQKSGTNITPGQTFTIEWGLGQVLPLKKDLSKLLQLGVIGDDQWQVSHSSGTLPVAGTPGIPESLIPFYSSHAIGAQSTFILPAYDLSFFFKYLDEYRTLASVQGRTFVFGLSWTLRIPKPAPAAPKP
jgi:hypothetical protein